MHTCKHCLAAPHPTPRYLSPRVPIHSTIQDSGSASRKPVCSSTDSILQKLYQVQFSVEINQSIPARSATCRIILQRSNDHKGGRSMYQRIGCGQTGPLAALAAPTVHLLSASPIPPPLVLILFRLTKSIPVTTSKLSRRRQVKSSCCVNAPIVAKVIVARPQSRQTRLVGSASIADVLRDGLCRAANV